MADENTNPFTGMSFGRAVEKLRRDPSLASQFDEVFKNEEEFDTLERARLHVSNSFYRGTTLGSAIVDGLYQTIEKGPPEVTKPEKNSVEEAQYRWAQRLRGAQLKVKGDVDPGVDAWNRTKQRYDAILDDLADYERMSDAKGFAQYGAAIGGALGGSIVTPENLAAWPIKGVSVLGKMFWGGVQAGAINTAVDPFIQASNLHAQTQKDYDPMQTALSFPIGFAIGGGLVGAGEVVSKSLLRKNMGEFTPVDPSVRSTRFDTGIKNTDVAEPGTITNETVIVINGEETRLRNGKVVKEEEAPAAEAKTETADVSARIREIDARTMELGDENYQLSTDIRNAESAKEDTSELWAKREKNADELLALSNERQELRPTKLITKEEQKVNQEINAEVARQPGGLRAEPRPSPDPENVPEVVKSLQTMVRELETDFGVPIRQGRLGVPNALGTFNIDTGIIHIKEYPDFSVAAHEIGHAIERKFGDLNTPATNPLSRLMYQNEAELRNLDYEQHPLLGRRVYEGYAEFIRLYLTNPAYVMKNAPQFYSAFNNFLERNEPETLARLIKFQQAFHAYNTAQPEQVVVSGIVRPTETWADKIVSKFTDAKIAPTFRNILPTIYEAMIDKNNDLGRSVREMGKGIKKALGGKLVDLLPSDDPRIHFRRLEKASQTTMAQARDGIVPYGGTQAEGPSITQALDMAVGKSWGTGNWNSETYNNFGAYMKARRGLHLWDRHLAGDLPNAPVAETRGQLQAVLDKFDVEYPKFREASDMIHEFNRNMLRKMVDSGAFRGLDEAAFERIIAEEPFYIPFQRDLSDKLRGEGIGGDNAGSGVYGIKGSMRDIIDPIAAMLNNLMKVEQQIAHADTARSLAKLAQAAGPYGGRFVERLPATEVKKIEFDLIEAVKKAAQDAGMGHNSAAQKVDDFFQDLFGDDNVTGVTFKTVTIDGKKEPIIFWNEAGELQAARFAKKEEGFGLYELMSTAPKPAADLMHELTSFVSSTLTTTVVSHPFYALRNIFRDQFGATAFVPGYVPGYHAVKGLIHHFKDDEFAQAYRQFGGVNPAGAIVPAYADAVAHDVDALAKQGFSVRKVFSMKGLAEMVSALEMGTRLGATEVLIKQKLKMGLSEYDAFLSAIAETSDLMPFDRHGSRVQGVRSTLPFLNAYMQGMDKVNRVLGVPAKRALFQMLGSDDGFVFRQDSEDGKKALWAFMTLGISGFAMGALWAAASSGRSQYDDASGRVKATNFVIPVGDQHVFLLPKPWELAFGFTAGELAYRRAMENDPRALEQLGTAAYETMTSPNLIFGNPLVGTTLGALSNYNFATGTPVVPEALAKRENWEQFDEKSGAFSKKLGKMLGWSPKKIDFMLSGYGGYWGADLAKLGNGNADDTLTGNLEDMTLARAGLRPASVVSDAREKFWKHMGKTTGDFAKANETYRMLNQSSQREAEAQAYFNTLSKDRKAWVTLHNAADENGKDAFKPDDRRSHPLERAANAVRVLNKMRVATATNTATDAEDKSALVVNPEVRKKIATILGTMGVAEMSNALKIMGEPGYAGRALVDMEVYMEQLKTLDSRYAEEVAKRYATEKIYKTEAVSRGYKQMEAELVRAGSQADLQLLTADVVDEGYEFGAERRKRPRVRRTPIKGE